MAMANAWSASAAFLQAETAAADQKTTTGLANPSEGATTPISSTRFNLNQRAPSDRNTQNFDTDGSMTGQSGTVAKFRASVDLAEPDPHTLLLQSLSPFDAGRHPLALSGTQQFSTSNGIGTRSGDPVINTNATSQTALENVVTQGQGPVVGSSTQFTISISTRNRTGQMNELDLPAGTNWTIQPQFGSANPANYRVALFDAQKNLIVSVPGSQLNTVNLALNTGRYYVQIDQTDAPADASSPTIPILVRGIPASVPSASVTMITPTNDNGLDQNADSILVQFDGSNIPAAYRNGASTVFSVLDDDGRSFRVTPSGFDQDQHQLLLGFSGPLPTGHYTLMATMPGDGGDMQSPPLRLGSFDTVEEPLPAGDLGTIYPNPTSASNVSMATLAPGQSVATRFSILAGQTYRINPGNANLQGQFDQVQSTGELDQLSTVASDQDENPYLNPGIYELVVTNTTGKNQQMTVAVAPSTTLAVELSTSAVGQLPAILIKSVTVAGSSSVGMRENFAINTLTPGLDGTGSIPVNNLDGSGGHGSPTTLVPPIETPGSISIASFDQLPLGSLAVASRNPVSANSSSPQSQDQSAPAGAAHDRSLWGPSLPMLDTTANPMLNHVAVDSVDWPEINQGNNNQHGKRFSIEQIIKAGLESRTGLDPGSLPLIPTASSTASSRSGPTGSTPIRALAISDLGLHVQAHGEPSVRATELADVTSPIGILVMTCVVYRRLKATRFGVNLPAVNPIPGAWQRLKDRLRPQRHQCRS